MTTPNPQPTQMEQRMELKLEWRCINCKLVTESWAVPERCTECGQRHFAKIATVGTRPTADLGDDGELVERLRRAEAYIRIANRSSLHADTVEQAADRLILYREALKRIEVFLRDCIMEPTLACAHTLNREADAVSAALTHVENEGK